MTEDFYTSKQVTEIVGCSYHQLQSCRGKGIVTPIVNPKSTGQSVYYSFRDLLALSVFRRFLDSGLSFETAKTVLGIV